jgi:membrane protease YdiL (CAAX protease family)
MNSERLKPLLAVLLVFVGAPFVGGLVSPWVFKAVSQIPHFDYPFYRVWSRCVMVAALLLVYPAYQLIGFRSVAEIGLPRTRSNFLDFWRYALVGAASMIALYAIGLWVGAYELSAPNWTTGRMVYKMATYVLGAFLVGIWEEIFFRGVIFSALRRGSGLIPGVLFGALVFAVPHFMRPLNPPDIDCWYAGFSIWGHIFGRAGNSVLQELTCLFLMGIALSILFVKRGDLYAAIGLHVGWVMPMMICRKFVDISHESAAHLWFFGKSKGVACGWIASILIGVYIAAFAAMKRRNPDPAVRCLKNRRPETRTGSPGRLFSRSEG